MKSIYAMKTMIPLYSKIGLVDDLCIVLLDDLCIVLVDDVCIVLLDDLCIT